MTVLGVIAPMAVTVFTLPIYLRLIGEERYGILALIWLVFGYFGLFDFGLSRATANHLARLRQAPAEEKAPVFFTALLMNAGLGLVGAVLLGVALTFASMMMSGADNGLRGELQIGLPWLVLLLPLSTVSGVFVGCLEAEERWGMINLQQVVGAVLQAVLPLVLVILLGANLMFAIVGTVVGKALVIAWSATAALRTFKGVKPKINPALLRPLLSYGGAVALTNSISPILASADRFVIASVSGLQAVTTYSVPFNIISKVTIVPAAVTRVLFPRFSSMAPTEAKALAERALGVLGGVIAMICCPIILLAHAGLSVWVGPDFAERGTTVTQVLAMGACFNALAYVPFALLQGTGRPNLVARIHLFELLPFLLILYVLVMFFGVEGAAWAWLMRVVADAVLLLHFTKLLRSSARALLPCAGAILVSFLTASLGTPLPYLVLLTVAISGAIIVWLYRTSPEWARMVRRVGSRLSPSKREFER